jgi:hypothetical protein
MFGMLNQEVLVEVFSIQNASFVQGECFKCALSKRCAGKHACIHVNYSGNRANKVRAIATLF